MSFCLLYLFPYYLKKIIELQTAIIVYNSVYQFLDIKSITRSNGTSKHDRTVMPNNPPAIILYFAEKKSNLHRKVWELYIYFGKAFESKIRPACQNVQDVIRGSYILPWNLIWFYEKNLEQITEYQIGYDYLSIARCSYKV